MNAKTTAFVILATIAAMTAVASVFVLTPAQAKISEVDTGSENPGGKEAPGQQPTAKGEGQTQFSENQNPAGSAPPGQNK
jgi:hypothetical protein